MFESCRGHRCNQAESGTVEPISRGQPARRSGKGSIVGPKSAAGERAVPIPKVLRALLAAHRLARVGDGYVFGSSLSAPFTPSAVWRRSRTAWKRAKLEPIGLHEARHTFASLMIAAGVNAKALAEYMGHSSIAITFDRYGHLMPGNHEQAAALLDAYLGGTSK
jgi:integrase